MQNKVIINQISYDLEGLLQNCWRRLVNGAVVAKNAFHSPSIATMNGDFPEIRTVILRKVLPEEKTLIFYTDYRSPKIEQIKANHKIAWLFYDEKARIQLRLKTIATIHHNNEVVLTRWNESRLESKTCYLVQPAPSTKTESPTDGLAAHFDRSHLTAESVALGYENFAVITNVVTEIEWLFLAREGHRRAKFILDQDGVKKYWLIP